jgi:pyrroline-5-carboxylate reductase
MKGIKIAVIGSGNMGSALIKGLVHSKQVAPGNIVAADAKPARLAELKKEFKIKTSKNNPEAAKTADVVVLAVKPQILDKVLTELKKSRKKDALFLSMAAGYPTSLIEKFLGGSPRVVRAMPNIAAAVGQAATALCRGKHARKKEFDLAKQMFSSCGTVEEVDETLMDAAGFRGPGPCTFSSSSRRCPTPECGWGWGGTSPPGWRCRRCWARRGWWRRPAGTPSS